MKDSFNTNGKGGGFMKGRTHLIQTRVLWKGGVCCKWNMNLMQILKLEPIFEHLNRILYLMHLTVTPLLGLKLSQTAYETLHNGPPS